MNLAALAALALLATAACDSIDLDARYRVEIIGGYELVPQACAAETTGPLADVLMSDCEGTPTWDEAGSEAIGACADPSYPILPNPPGNPNPTYQKVRARIVHACDHPRHAVEVGCESDDARTRLEAEQALVIEYRDGLFPFLPEPMGTYCPMVARPR